MQKILRLLPKGKSSSTNEDDDLSESEDVVPDMSDRQRQQSIDMTASRIDSFSSVTSIYSADGGKGSYRISGEVRIGVWLKKDLLFVRVVKARGLAAAKSGGVSDPYVKTYLLPDRSKHTKRKTGIQRKTINPEYNEILKAKLLSCDIKLSTLWVSVWDWDKYGRNKFLGEVRLSLSPPSLDLTNPSDRWYRLQERTEEEPIKDKGKLKVAIKFCPYSSRSNLSPKVRKGSLFVSVKAATGLPIMDPNGLTDASVKLYLLPSRNTFAKKTTKTIPNDLNPTWNEEFEYKRVSLEELATSRALELTVWDYDRRGCKDFIGCLRLGPSPEGRGKHRNWMDSIGDEVVQWEEMLSGLGEWVEYEHRLRPSIQDLSVSIDEVRVDPETHEEQSGGASTSTDRIGSSTEQDHTGSVPHVSGAVSGQATSFDSAYSDDEVKNSDSEDSLSGSKVSLYSESCVKGNYTITGEVCISLEYRKRQLRVTIHDARNLAAADSNGFSDPYIKTYLLPEKSKHSQRKTIVRKKTLNPIYNETLLYDVEESALTSRTLWFSIWDWDRFGKNEFLGEVKLPLSDVDIGNCKRQRYPFQDTDNFASISSAAVADYRGKLQIGLMFDPNPTKKGKNRGTLHVHIISAQSLPNMDTQGYTDGFVTMQLLPNNTKKKSRVVNDDLNPTWNEKFTFRKVSFEELSSQRALQLKVWDHDMGFSNDFIGGLRLGPNAASTTEHREEWMDSNSKEAQQWEDMLAHPGEWVECGHSLRASMDHRKFANPELVVRESEDSFPRIEEEEEEEEEEDTGSASFRPRGSFQVGNGMKDYRKRTPAIGLEELSALSLQGSENHSEESTAGKETLTLPEKSHNSVSPSPSPVTSPVTSPVHVKHYSSDPSNDENSSQAPDLGDAAQKRLYSASQDPPAADLDDVDTGSNNDAHCITGEVLCGVSFKNGQLLVTIEQAKGLATSADKEPPTPYIEVLLLPEKTKYPAKRTVEKMRTCDPEYNYQIKFKISQSELSSHTVCLRARDSNQAAGRKFLGEVNLLLTKELLSDPTTHWHSLQDTVETGEKAALNLAVKFQSTSTDKKGRVTGDLHVLFKQTRNLPSSDCNIKCSLLSSGRRKPSIINCQSLPICNEELIFQNLKLSELATDKGLEINLWDLRDRLLGGVRLCPAPGRGGKRKEWMDSLGEETRHWELVISHLGEWQEVWHTLRTTS